VGGLNTIISDFIVGLGMSEALAQIIVSGISVILWIFVGLFLNFAIKKTIYRIMKSSGFKSRTTTIGKLLISVSRYTLWLIIFIAILREMNVDVMPIVASAGVVGLAIGFGAQQIIRDFISGFFIMFEGVFNVGDLVEIDGFTGNVVRLGLRTTVTQNWKGQVKTVSNGDIRGVINYSKNDSLAVVEFGVSYDTDLSKLTELMDEFCTMVFDKHENIIIKPQFLGVTKLDNSSVNLLLTAKTKTLQHFGVERLLRQDIVTFFGEKGIEIPYPHLVVKNA
jgi:small-conductance mechanosensitive channel